MIKTSVLVLGLVAVTPHSAHAQDPPDRGASYAIDRWTIADGLPQSSVTGIEQTRDGYLWLTTFGGVVRFDGVHFAVFDLATHPTLGGHRFVGVAEDGRGDLYLGIQDQGLTRYRQGRFEAVEIPGPPHGGVVGPLKDPSGTLWATVGDAVIQIRDGQVTREVVDPELLGTDLAPQVDRAGALWLSSTRGIVCWSGPCERPRERVEPTVEWLESVSHSRSGGRWNTSWGPLGGCFESHRPRRWIRTFRWRDQTWCGVGRELIGGSTRLDLGAQAPWETHDVIEVSSLHEDREGALWVGTSGGGLFQIRSRELRRYGASHGLSGGSVWGLVEDGQRRVWVSSWEGLRVIEGGRVRMPEPAVAALEPLTTLASDRDGALWLASRERGLHRLDASGLHASPIALPPQAYVSNLFFDAQGGTWIAVRGEGVTRWVDGAATERWSEDALGGTAQVMREGPGGVRWFGTASGVARVQDGVIQRLGREQGLAPGTIRDLLVRDDGTVWAGSYGGGLSRIQGQRISRVTRDQGLCDNVASRLIDDGAGSLWVNGNRGVYHVRFTDLSTVADGLASSLQCALVESGEGNGNSGFRAADGRMWFPTITGVVAIDPIDPRPPVAPIAHIEAISFAGRPLVDGQEVPSSRGDLVVEMTALSFVDPRGLFFRHRLSGYEGEWVDAGTTRVARYTRLPPGRYRFEVQARSVRGVWSAPVAIGFSVEPHFFERNRFYALCLLALLASVWGIAMLRTRAVRARNRALQGEIDEREKVTAALRAEEAHYRALFERTSDGLFIHAADGRLIEINPAGCALTGRTREALLAGAPLHYVDPAARAGYRALLEAVLAGDSSGRHESRFVGRDGAPVEVRLQGARLDDNGAPQALLCAVDLTSERTAERERRDLERQLRQSQKLEALGQLAGGIAHDFNNLLTAIGVQASLLQGADAEDLEAIEGIQAAVKRASALTKKLLVFGTKDLHSPRVIVLHDRLDELMAVLKRTVPADVAIELVHHAGPVHIKVDPVRLEQTIINLVVNARDAIGGSGSVRITTELTPIDEPEAARHGARGGEYVVISVSDSGSGIDEAIIDRIFEPFFTTKSVGKGSGLGLSIVHGAMREAGGFVTVESRRGEGTTFRLYFPVEASDIDVPETLDLAPPRADGVSVLLCDDEPMVRQVAARALRSAGYRVLEAATPDDAVEIAQAEMRNLKALVTDVVMPQMSGPELAQKVRGVVGELPVLFISGHTRDLVGDRGVMSDAEFLGKPFTVNMLVRRVGALIARSTPSAGMPTVRPK